MIRFELLWIFFVLPLPLIMLWFWPAYGSNMSSVQAPFFDRLLGLNRVGLIDKGLILPRRHWQYLLIGFLWCSLIMSAARPIYLGEPIEVRKPARDLMVMVDLSGSMAESDFGDGLSQTRLSGAKAVLNQFVRDRAGDRLALVVFANAPYLLMPFSADGALFTEMLADLKVGMAGPKTLLGDAIGFAYQHFVNAEDVVEKAAEKKRVLILITDGNDSGSLIPTEAAAKIAASASIRIHTILLGKLSASEADLAINAIDEAALKRISDISGGQFFHAEHSSSLLDISRTIDGLEPSEFSVTWLQPRRELFYWPLAFALFVAQLIHLVLAIKQRGRADV